MGEITIHPHFVYGQQYGQQALNFSSATAQYPGYGSLGVEIPGTWDNLQGQGLACTDSQLVHYNDMTVDVPFSYYGPNYTLCVQPSYNNYPSDYPINPSASSGGFQHHSVDPAYYPASRPNFYPSAVSTSGADNTLFGVEPQPYTDAPFCFSYAGIDAVKLTTSSATSAVFATPKLAVMPINPSATPPLYIEQFVGPVKPANTVLPNLSSMKPPVSALDASHFTKLQACNAFGYVKPSECYAHEVIPSASYAKKGCLASNNGIASIKSDLRQLITAKKFTPSLNSDEANSLCRRANLSSEQSPVTLGHGVKPEVMPAVACKAYTSMLQFCNSEGRIIIRPEQYNRADFPLDYSCAKFFVIKSYCADDVHKSIKYNVWSSTPNGNKKLNAAYEEAQQVSMRSSIACPVFLFFSVNGSGHFCGVAEMVGPVDFHMDMDFWHQDKWSGNFPVKWHIIKNVPNTTLRHFILENNEYLPVTYSRDTQEVYLVPGIQILHVFKNSAIKESILDDFLKYEELERTMVKGRSKLRYNAPVFIPRCAWQGGPSGLHHLKDDKAQGAGLLSSTRNEAENLWSGKRIFLPRSAAEAATANFQYHRQSEIEACELQAGIHEPAGVADQALTMQKKSQLELPPAGVRKEEETAVPEKIPGGEVVNASTGAQTYTDALTIPLHLSSDTNKQSDHHHADNRKHSPVAAHSEKQCEHDSEGVATKSSSVGGISSNNKLHSVSPTTSNGTTVTGADENYVIAGQAKNSVGADENSNSSHSPDTVTIVSMTVRVKSW